MTEKIKEKLKDLISILPKENREAIDSSDWENISKEIGKTHLLTEEEIESLQLEIGLVLTGVVDPILLSLNLENEVGINTNEAEKIAIEVLEKIFNPLVDKISGKIKNTLKNRPIHWQQNLDFILSGGDYTAFIRRVENKTEEQNILNIKNNFNPSKLDDLKSKFTI